MAEDAGAGSKTLEMWLEQALDREPEERQTWLEEAIEDRRLRDRVGRLAVRAEEVGDFLERPAAAALGAVAGEGAGLPETVGPYRIVGLLGEGGMGVVYLAEQTEPVTRRLALKVLRVSLTTPEAVARFESERRVLARLRHPNIAALHEAGTTGDGQRYFAMEWVDGLPLIAACDEAVLSLSARIELFLEVCDAVQHAHHKGILHRDLKPSNVLVARLGDRLVPKVIDFGVARTLDAEATLGGPVGTPAYMSPESVGAGGERAEPDVRSDVYSLGVLLYELLAGERPHMASGSTPGKLLWEIVGREIPPPSQRFVGLERVAAETHAAARGLDRRRLARRLAGDLDAIVLEATARAPEGRYPTVESMAADLRRHLRLEPVEAARPGPLHRLVKLARRHRAAFGAAAVALLALVAGSVGTTLGMVRAGREADGARKALAEAKELSNFLTGLFELGDPDRSRGEDLRVRELLDRAAIEVRSRFSEQPLVRARLERTLGDVYVHLGLYDDARPLLAESLDVVEREAGGDTRELAAGRRSLGLLAFRKARYDEAETLLRSALDLHEPGSLPYAMLTHDLGALYLDQRRLDEAEPLFRRALEIREAHLGRDHPDVALVLDNLGYVLHARGRDEEALALQREALNIRERHLGPEHPHVAASLLNLGLTEITTGRLGEAKASIRRAAAIWEKVYGKDHPQVEHALTALARIATREERWHEAEALYLRSIEILETGYGADHPELAVPLNNLGSVYWNLERYRDAEPCYRRSLAIRERAVGTDSPWLGYPLGNLGLVRWKLGDFDGAEALLRQSLELWREDLADGQAEARRKVWPLWGLAGVTAATGRYDEAEALYRRALAIVERAPEGAAALPRVREDFAAFLRASGREAEAREVSARQ